MSATTLLRPAGGPDTGPITFGTRPKYVRVAPYLSDHTNLLEDLADTQAITRYTGLPLVDAIAVPAARPAHLLRGAARVAKRSARVLIVLCSKGCDYSRVCKELEDLDLGALLVVVDMEGYRFPHLSRTLTLDRRVRWTTDTAVKRNTALLIARCLGLRHVFFLDDDVTGVRRAELGAAVAAIERGHHRAAGWRFTDFPDNSVVSHAYRMVRDRPFGTQECFIGGGGLVVQVDDAVPHFPLGIYNEDWFFLFPMLRSADVAEIGELKQLPFDPFANADSADGQEFGDVMAEGLLTCLARNRERRSDVQEEWWEADFWEGVLERRSEFFGTVTRAFADPAKIRPTFDLDRAKASVSAAQQALVRLDKYLLRDWMLAWRSDGEGWSDQLRRAGDGAAPELDDVRAVRDRIDDGLAGLALDRRRITVHEKSRRRPSVPFPA